MLALLLVDVGSSNPNSFAEEKLVWWATLKVLVLQEVRLYAVVIL